MNEWTKGQTNELLKKTTEIINHGIYAAKYLKEHN